MEKTSDEIIDNSEAKGPAKKLGLSKLVYGLGMSARDSLVTFLAATAALFPIMYAGQGKNKTIDQVATFPDKIKNFAKERMGGERAGKTYKALVVSAGVASLIGYAAHVPGLFRGPKKVKEAENLYNAEVDDNRQLASQVKTLAETVSRQGVELTAAKKQAGTFVERVKAPEAANSHTLSL